MIVINVGAKRPLFPVQGIFKCLNFTLSRHSVWSDAWSRCLAWASKNTASKRMAFVLLPCLKARWVLLFICFCFKQKLWKSLVNPSYKKKRWKLQTSEISMEGCVPWLCSTVFPFSFYTFTPISDLTFVLCHGYEIITDPSLCATSCHLCL